MLVPHPLEEFFAGNGSTLGGEKVLQHGEFFGAEGEALAGAHGDAASGVDSQVADDEAGGQRRTGPTAQGAYTGDQLSEREGLASIHR